MPEKMDKPVWSRVSILILMKTKYSFRSLLLVLTCWSLTLSTVSAAESLVQYVNILQGTDSEKKLSHGNTLPLVGMPWGMATWSIQNSPRENGPWFFSPNGTIDGFRATHQPSPWMGDYAQFLVMPDVLLPGKTPSNAYNTNTAVFQPDYERLDLRDGALTAELTGTERCGVFRLTYHEGTTGGLLIKGFGYAEIKVKGRKIYGVSHTGGRSVPFGFGGYFVISMDRDITEAKGPLTPPAATVATGDSSKSKKPELDRYVQFAVSGKEPVLIKIGTSYIGWDQAERNLENETKGSFDAIHDRVASVWNKQLGKVEIEASTADKKTFYSCLYHALVFPQSLYELDANGKSIHYSPYNGKIHDVVLYGDIGIWDAFRTTFPLITLLYPNQLDEILEGFVNASKEGDGTLPEWPCPGYRRCMIGQHCAAIFADAVAKDRTGFDLPAAYESLRKSAYVPPSHGMIVRDGLDLYLKLGYTPGIRYSVSTALDYAYDDWCVARIAKHLNHADIENELMVRAQNYRKLWDPSVGFMRDKKADGQWVEKFDEFAWGGPYAESGPWQASWFVPHDPAGLAGLLGGRELFVAKMDKLMSLPPTYHVGGYGGPIHEMVEMEVIQFGQCAMGNQPSFDIPYMFAAMGQPWKTEYFTRRACTQLFHSDPRGFPGDDDNGSTSSWYILSAIGLYPFCPGTPQYIVTSPLFTKATLHLANDKTLQILAPKNSSKNVYVQKREWNRKTDSRVFMTHQELIQGGKLHFEMGPEPKEVKAPVEDLPYSATAY